ncbi:MAG: hypothetical protein ACXWC0_11185 [Burkholderiales bacterium]
MSRSHSDSGSNWRWGGYSQSQCRRRYGWDGGPIWGFRDGLVMLRDSPLLPERVSKRKRYFGCVSGLSVPA